MFGWYRSQIKEYGLVDATSLLWRVGWSRTNVRLANKLLPDTNGNYLSGDGVTKNR